MKTIENTNVDIKEYEEFYLVSVNNVNKINILNASALESKVARLIENSNKTIYLNLEEIIFIDSNGFNMLLKMQRLAFLSNLSFVIYNLDEELKELFDVLGLISEFKISKDGPTFITRSFLRKIS